MGMYKRVMARSWPSNLKSLGQEQTAQSTRVLPPPQGDPSFSRKAFRCLDEAYPDHRGSPLLRQLVVDVTVCREHLHGTSRLALMEALGLWPRQGTRELTTTELCINYGSLPSPNPHRAQSSLFILCLLAWASRLFSVVSQLYPYVSMVSGFPVALRKVIPTPTS